MAALACLVRVDLASRAGVDLPGFCGQRLAYLAARDPVIHVALSKAQYDSLKQSKTAAIRKGRLVADTIDVRLRQADIGDLQLEGFVTLTQMNEICGINPRSSSHNFEPFSECPGACLMESSARHQMTL